MRASKRIATWIVRGLALSALLAVSCGPSPQSAPTAAPSKAAATQPAAKPTAAQPAAKPAAQATAKPAVPAKPSGDVIYVAPDFGPEKWDPSMGPQLNQSTGFGIGGPIFETLYLHFPPNAEVRPFLLEKGEMAKDGMSWTFKLRDGIRFSNGDPMTAEDVKFSLDRYRSDVAVSSSASLFRQTFADVQVVDRLTTRVLLKKPLITLPIYLAGWTGNDGIIMPKKYIEQVGWDTFNRQPIGSGPYKVTEHKIGQSITYEANENFWRSAPTYARIRNLMVPEQQARIAILTSGQADMIFANPESKKLIEQAGFKTLVVPYGTMWRIHFYGATSNYPDNPLQKLEVRKALTLAMNKQEMMDALFGGAGEVAAYAHSAPGASLGAPKLSPTPYDPAEAKRLLSQAGYPNGFDLTLYAPNIGCSTDQARRFAEATGAFWEQIGVKVQLRPIEYDAIRAKIRGNIAPEFIGTASTFCTATSALAQRDLSTFWYSKEGWQMSNAADAEIEKAQNAMTQEELVQWSEAAYKRIYENYANIGVFHAGLVFGASKKVADYPITAGFSSMLRWLVQDRPS